MPGPGQWNETIALKTATSGNIHVPFRYGFSQQARARIACLARFDVRNAN